MSLFYFEWFLFIKKIIGEIIENENHNNRKTTIFIFIIVLENIQLVSKKVFAANIAVPGTYTLLFFNTYSVFV